MKYGKQPHILTTASNLLGICLVIITGLKVSKASIDSYADEISLFASFALLISCFLSYLSISVHKEKSSNCLESIADFMFLVGIISLFIAICFLAYTVQ